MDDVLLTCQSISFESGYPVLSRVFRHLAKTPDSYIVWLETARPGIVHLLAQYSNRTMLHLGDWELRGAGQDFVRLSPPSPDFEGGAEIVIVEPESGNERVSRHVHYGGT